MQGAVFARVGRDDDNGTSAARQVEECKAYATEQGIEVVRVFSQTGKSSMREVVEGLWNGEYQTIVTTHPSRISRDFETFLHVLGEVKDAGGTIHITSHRKVLP